MGFAGNGLTDMVQIGEEICAPVERSVAKNLSVANGGERGSRKNWRKQMHFG